jgi:hypothetical protein
MMDPAHFIELALAGVIAAGVWLLKRAIGDMDGSLRGLSKEVKVLNDRDAKTAVELEKIRGEAEATRIRLTKVEADVAGLLERERTRKRGR